MIRLTSKHGNFVHIKEAMDAGKEVFYARMKVVEYRKSGTIRTEGDKRFFVPWIPAITIIT